MIVGAKAGRRKCPLTFSAAPCSAVRQISGRYGMTIISSRQKSRHLLRQQAREQRDAAEQPDHERDAHEQRRQRRHDRVEQPPRVARRVEAFAGEDRDERRVQRAFAKERAKEVRHAEGHEEHVRRGAGAEEARGGHFAHEAENPAGQRAGAGLHHAGENVVFFRHPYSSSSSSSSSSLSSFSSSAVVVHGLVRRHDGRVQGRGRVRYIHGINLEREPAMPYT